MVGVTLRVGLVLDSDIVPAWIFRAIERLAQSESIEISLVIRTNPESFNTQSSQSNQKDKHASIIYQLFDILDQKLFVRGLNAGKKKNLRDLLSEIKSLSSVDISRETQEIDGLDILVNFGSGNLDFAVFSGVKYGIWEYTFGEDQPIDENLIGYWETIENRPLTGVRLCSRSSNGLSSHSIYESSLSTYNLSPARNRNAIQWYAASFLARQCELLTKLGDARFTREISKFNRALPRDKIRTKFPTNWEVIQGAISILIRIIRELWFRTFYRDLWWLLFRFSNLPTFDINCYQRIQPPSDRFWADPFITKENDRYFLFVEEYIYRRKKGHISVIEIDQEGNHKESIPVLMKDYHMSYPCIVKSNGAYYMIPESAANHTIDLYECDVFPTKWKYCMTLMEGIDAVDTTLIFYENKWWMFTGIRENNGAYPDVELFLFSANELLTSKWKSHPLNPVVSDVSCARPAGAIFVDRGNIYRPSQDCTKIYGNKFNINQITLLNENEYEEKRILTVRPDWEQNILATHTYSFQGGLNMIDAFTRKPILK